MTAPVDASPSFLIINVCRIGDTVMGTPAIRAVASAYPRSEITCLGHPKRYQVLEHLPFIHAAGPISKNRTWWRGWLPGKRWDYALVYGYDRALVRYALRVARHVVAFTQGDAQLDARLYRHVARPPLATTHGVDLALALPELLGIPAAGRHLAYQVTHDEAAFARTLLDSRIGSRRPLIGLLLESFPTKAYRDWPLANFIALARRIKAQYRDAHFLVFGGSLAPAKRAQLTTELGADVTILAGELTLRQSAAVMQQLDLYVGVDTGPTHIAGALNIPMVAMYHCLHPSAGLKPLDRPGVYVIDHPAMGTANCQATSSMADVTVDQVFSRVVTALSESAAPAKEAVA